MTYHGNNPQYFYSSQPFALECGKLLGALQIAYHTYGTLNAAKDNVVWICHALTANSDAADWWAGMVGNGLVFDTSKYFVVCANVIGSCYGSTGPLSINPATGKPYYRTFPQVTVRDMAAVHELLRLHLGIGSIKMIVGGSVGAFQAIEWCIMRPEVFGALVFVAAGAYTTPWVIALSEAQRMAIEADPTFAGNTPSGGAAGLAAARAMALTSYRNYHTYNQTQKDPDRSQLGNYRVATYQRYQGAKLVQRFDAYSYYLLTQALDTHDISRTRNGTVERILQNIAIPTLIIGISSDILFPVCEQKFMATLMPNAIYREVESEFGHDGFLIETVKLNLTIRNFWGKKVK
jgi:homoserine O-acetyltransferase